MDTVTIKDKEFAISIPEEKILSAIERLAVRLNRDLEDKNPLFLCVLNGSFIFAADLLRRISVPSEISFVKFATYDGTASTGKLKELVGLSEDIAGRTVVVVEDIVDTGFTMQKLIEELKARSPKAVHVCALLLKPNKLKIPLGVEYVALEIPDDFIVGYGLDYDGYGRNLRDIYTMVE